MKKNERKSAYETLHIKISHKKRNAALCNSKKCYSTKPIEHTDKCCSEVVDGSYWNILKLLVSVILSIIASAPFTLIPQHDAIKYPQYWYETHIAIYFGFGLSRTIYDMMECKHLFQINSFLSLKSFLLIQGFFIV